VNNKHDCAGYGDDNTTNNGDAKDSIRKAARRESHAPPPKPAQPIDPQLTRPSLQHTMSTMSQQSNSTTNSHVPKREDDDRSSYDVLSLSTRNRMPYFRYFGPTAIMPGFKQMVVKVRGKQHGSGQTTSDRTSSYTSHGRSVSLCIMRDTTMAWSCSMQTTTTANVW
jgi:hypothetical protein